MRKRVRRGTIMVLAFLATLVCLFYAVENWRGARQWAACRSELEQKGEKLDFAAFVPAPVPDEQNFADAPVFKNLFDPSRREKILEAAPTTWFSHAPNRPERNWNKGQRVDLVAWEQYLRGVTNMAPVMQGTNAAENVLRGLAQFYEALAQLREYSLRPKSRFDLRYDAPNPADIRLAHLTYLKQVTDVLALRAEALLALGRADEAGREVDLILRLADSLQGEPFIVSELVRESLFHTACRTIWGGLADHQWSEAQLQRWQRKLSGQDFSTGLLAGLRMERVLEMQTIESICQDPKTFFRVISTLTRDSTFEAELSNKWLVVLLPMMPAGWWRMEQSNHAMDFQSFAVAPLVERLAKPQPVLQTLREVSPIFENRTDKANSYSGLLAHRMIVKRLMNPMEGLFFKVAYKQSAVQMAAIACALERQWLAKGAYPATLEALAPDIQKDFAGPGSHPEVLRYHPTNKGRYLLYSDGWNGVDDGGKMAWDGDSLDLHAGDWVWPQVQTGSPK